MTGGGIGTDQAFYGKVSIKPGHESYGWGDDLDRGKSLEAAGRASCIWSFNWSWRVYFLVHLLTGLLAGGPRSLHTGPTLGFPCVLVTEHLTFSLQQLECSEEESIRNHSIFYDLILDVTYCHSHFILVITSKTKSWICERGGEFSSTFFEARVKEQVDALTHHSVFILFTEARKEI